MIANPALLESDPFEFLLRQKTGRQHPQRQKSIKLNLNRLPADFFPLQRVRRLQSHSERSPLPNAYNNQFLHYHRTLDLHSERKASSHAKDPKRINPFSVKRESVCSSRREEPHHTTTEPKEDYFESFNFNLEGFNCTFAKRMNQECMMKKVQLPLLEVGKKGKDKGRARVRTQAVA